MAMGFTRRCKELDDKCHPAQRQEGHPVGASTALEDGGGAQRQECHPVGASEARGSPRGCIHSFLIVDGGAAAMHARRARFGGVRIAMVWAGSSLKFVKATKAGEESCAHASGALTLCKCLPVQVVLTPAPQSTCKAAGHAHERICTRAHAHSDRNSGGRVPDLAICGSSTVCEQPPGVRFPHAHSAVCMSTQPSGLGMQSTLL